MVAASIQRIRFLIFIFIAGLFLSGVTALPLETEINVFAKVISVDTTGTTAQSGFQHWIGRVRKGVVETNAKYPFMAYGTDWLAFGHFMIALAFIGPWRDPVKNVWVIDFGMIACVLVVPFALIAGEVRGIPFGWRLIDCSFGIFGIIPLIISKRMIRRLAAA